MNESMSALLRRAGLAWPLTAPTFQRQLPTLEIFEDCVLLKNQRDPNYHVNIADCFDRTGFECFINHVHLPFSRTRESLMSCLEYAETLEQALMPLTPDRRFRVMVALPKDDESPESACTVRFHQIRTGENWIADDIEGYKSEAVLVFDVMSSGKPLWRRFRM
jgi:hypothetical protein